MLRAVSDILLCLKNMEVRTIVLFNIKVSFRFFLLQIIALSCVFLDKPFTSWKRLLQRSSLLTNSHFFLVYKTVPPCQKSDLYQIRTRTEKFCWKKTVLMINRRENTKTSPPFFFLVEKCGYKAVILTDSTMSLPFFFLIYTNILNSFFLANKAVEAETLVWVGT